MMSIKTAFVLSMAAIGASTFGVSAYVANRPPVLAQLVETDFVPSSPTRFEFRFASSRSAENSAVARHQVTLDPVIVYGGNSARVSARHEQKPID